MASVSSEPSLQLSVQKDIPPGPLEYLLPSSGSSSLSLAKGDIFPEKVSGSTHSVSAVLVLVSILVH